MTFVRAYAAIAQDLDDAGYSDSDIQQLQAETENFTEIRKAIKQHSNEELDIKPYEADMRHLINTYIQADHAEGLGDLSQLSLTELIIETGIHDAIAKKLNAKGKLSKNAVAEGIINNVRKTIIREQLTDPRFYDQMSRLLDDLIRQKRDDTESYEEFLRDAEALVKKMAGKGAGGPHPAILNGHPEAIVIFNNLATLLPQDYAVNEIREPDPTEIQVRAALALEIDRVMREKAPADFRGDETRERQVLNELFPLLSRNRDATAAIFEIIKQQPGY